MSLTHTHTHTFIPFLSLCLHHLSLCPLLVSPSKVAKMTTRFWVLKSCELSHHR